jgi:hypothetical protein
MGLTLGYARQNAPAPPALRLCIHGATAYGRPAEVCRNGAVYAGQLQAVSITRIISPGSGAAVLLETGYGAVYVRYPAAVEPLAFVLNIGPYGLHCQRKDVRPGQRRADTRRARARGRAGNGRQQQIGVGAGESRALKLFGSGPYSVASLPEILYSSTFQRSIRPIADGQNKPRSWPVSTWRRAARSFGRVRAAKRHPATR